MSSRREPAASLSRALRRRGRLFLETSLILAALATGVVLLLPVSYRSSVVFEAESADRVRSGVEQLMSDPAVERAASLAVGDSAGYSVSGRERLRANSDIEAAGPNRLRVSFVARDPQMAYRVTERLAQASTERMAHEWAETPMGQSSGSPGTDLDDLKALIDDRQAQLDAYRQSHLPDNAAVQTDTARAFVNAQTQAQSLADSITRDREQLRSLEKAVESASPPDAAASAPADDNPKLAVARATLAELETRLTPMHPDVIRQRDLVRDLEAAAAVQSTPVVVIRGSKIAAEESKALADRIAAKEQQQRRLQQSIASMRASLATASHDTPAPPDTLTHEYDVLTRLYARLLASIQALDQASHQSNALRIVEPPQQPNRPFAPNRRRAIAFTTAAAFLAGLLTAFVADARDTRIHDDDDLRQLAAEVPLLATVNEVVTKAQARGQRVRAFFRALVSPALALAVAIGWWWAR